MDITLYRGADQDISFSYVGDSGTARSLVGATVYFTVKPNPFDTDSDDSDATISATVTSHTNPSAGVTLISLTDTQTTVDPKVYFYDIKVKEDDGKVYVATTGRLTVTPNVTNRIS